MTSLLRAELLKLRTAPRTAIGLTLALLAIVALGTVGAVVSAAGDGAVPESVLREVVGVAATTTFFALLLGIVLVTSEYRHGTATHTFLVAPRRELVLAAKVVVGAAVGVALAVLAVALGLGIAVALLAGDPGFDAAREGVADRVARLVLASVLWAVLGVALGALLHTQVGAIVAVFVWFMVAEPLVGVFADEVAGRDIVGYLPTHALQPLLGVSDELSFAAALAVTLGYAVVFGALGVGRTLRSDVT